MLPKMKACLAMTYILLCILLWVELLVDVLDLLCLTLQMLGAMKILATSPHAICFASMMLAHKLIRLF